jgi:hypothetical protein
LPSGRGRGEWGSRSASGGAGAPPDRVRLVSESVSNAARVPVVTMDTSVCVFDVDCIAE